MHDPCLGLQDLGHSKLSARVIKETGDFGFADQEMLGTRWVWDFGVQV